MMTAKDRDNSCNATPTLSVVICTRDRPESLVNTLRSLSTQNRKADELLILDDGCLGESNRERIGSAACAAASDWRIISTGGCGLTASRNLAARSVKGDILLFLDDDVTCEPQVVEEIVRLMSDPLVAGVTATVIEPAFRSRSARFFQWGYRLAGWWGVGPRGTPLGPRPLALKDPSIARCARWLSGAAMALRRSVVLANPFDESLKEYALGEDREMGYRLTPDYWLLESTRARVVHRRDGGGRADPYRMGFMTARNYVYILRRTCELTVIDAFLIAWSFFVFSMMHAVCGVAARKSHWSELRGLIAGVLVIIREFGNDQSRAVLSSVVREGTQNGNSLTVHRREDTPALTEDTSAPITATPVSINQPSLRALFVTNRLTHGGAERMLLTLVKRLPALGITPTIACLQDAGPLARECESDSIVVHDGILRHKTDVAVILRLRQIIEAAKIDVVVVAHSGGDRMFWPTLAATASDLPVVVWSHWFPRAGVAHIERPNRALYRLIDSFVALGEAHRVALIRHEHMPAGRMSVIPNGIDLDPFNRANPRERIRRELGLADHQIGVGLIANLRPEKRHDVFIEAAVRVAGAGEPVQFFLIGDGPDRERVESLIQRAGLNASKLRMLGARDDAHDLFCGLDIACLCSDVECQPVVMLEAAAAGCAFIGPNVGCIPEFLSHRATGLLVKPSDPAGLADAISELSRDADLRLRLASAASVRVRESYGAVRMAEQFAGLLQQCVHDRRQGRRSRVRRSRASSRPIAMKTP